jgi:pyruvate/2-oxoglutarate dehydrogenase complex dihydrolipoamide dehydrogenase (E3) component/uncharacterized membrane protein YdjX (TVP38/TMEM64 family)
MKTSLKFVFLILLTFTLIASYQLGYFSYLNLDFVKNSLVEFRNYDNLEPIQTKLIFFISYIAVVAINLPGATFLTLLAGALFGLVNGFLIVSFASTIGASLAFLISRFLFRDWIQSKFGEQLNFVNEGLKNDGAFYLLTLRLIPAFPFFLINVLMGLTQIKLFTFYWVSQIGMLAGTFIYVQAGVELSKINNIKDIVGPSMILTFTALGLMPFVFKWVIAAYKNKKIYEDFKKPSQFDYNTVVIGAGAAGLVSSYISAAVKAKVALIESNKMGGDCLNYGCVPSKALIKSAKVAHLIKNSSKYGIESKLSPLDFNAVMTRVKNAITGIEPHDSVDRYSKLGVDCYSAKAEVLSPFEVRVNDKVLTTKNIIIASGAEPVVPNVEGLNKVKYLTSESLWNLNQLPAKFLVIGGGAIGCELAQAFQRLGSKVTLIEKNSKILGRSDEKASSVILSQLLSEGVDVRLNSELINFVNQDQATISESGKSTVLEFDKVLFALGRKARAENSGLDVLKLELNPNKTIKHNEFMQTRFSNIYVCGDVAGPIQLTHVAAHQAWYASVNALFSPVKKFKVDYSVVPSVVFTDPEVAQVGLTTAEAKSQGLVFQETVYEIDDLDRAICEGDIKGFIKILTKQNSDQIIGATIVSANAGELIAELSLAMKYKLGLKKILGTIHSYPTWSESLKMTAGRWQQNNKPEKLLNLVKCFHKIRRG